MVVCDFCRSEEKKGKKRGRENLEISDINIRREGEEGVRPFEDITS